MKNSLKKFSMLAILGLTMSLNLKAHSSKSASKEEFKPASIIKVINLSQGQVIAKSFEGQNYEMPPISGGPNKGSFELDQNPTYFAMFNNIIVPNTTHAGSDFVGKKTWNIATNKIS
jgi:hypothetical protein